MTIWLPTAIRRPSEVEWALRGNTQVFESPFDGSQQTLEQPGARWMATATWNLGPDDRRVMEAFLGALRGRAGRFWFGPPHGFRRAPTGASPLINGAGQTGSTLNIGNWAPAYQAFKAGDFLSFQDPTTRWMLHMVTEDVTTNGLGEAVTPITPPIRRSPANLAPVRIDEPIGVFMLTDDAGGSVHVRPPSLATVTLSMVEALV